MRDLDQLLALDVMCRRDRWRQLEPGSPKAAAQSFMLAIHQRDHLDAVVTYLHPDLLDRWFSDRDIRAAVTQGLARARQSIERQTLTPRLMGFIVTDSVVERGERLRVGVNVLLEMRASEAFADLLLSGGDQPLLGMFLPGKVGEVVRTLEPTDLSRSVRELSKGMQMLAAVDIELEPVAGEWKVTNVISTTPDFELVEVVDRAIGPSSSGKPTAIPAEQVKTSSPDPRRQPIVLGVLLALAAGIFVVVLAALRSRRR